MNKEEIRKKLNSITLYLMAHPDNKKDSECEDRLDDLVDIFKELNLFK